MRIGAHESIAGGLLRAFERADASGDEAIQIFTTNGSRWAPARRDPAEIREFAQEARRRDVPLMAHDSYLINLASSGELRKKSRAAFVAELERCEALQVRFVVMHPGAHCGVGRAEGIRRIVRELRHAVERTDGYQVRILVELTAGQGTCLGHSFEDLAEILGGVDAPRRTGVCFDTCHAYAAGHDLRADYEGVWRRFDEVVGLDRLFAFHLNDSKRELGSHVDRHADIGVGHLGDSVFRKLVRDPRFAEVPAVLELPPTLVGPSVARLKSWRARRYPRARAQG